MRTLERVYLDAVVLHTSISRYRVILYQFSISSSVFLTSWIFSLG